MVCGRGVRLAALGLALAACVLNAWAGSSVDAPSKQQIRDWIKVLDTTWGRLTPPGVSVPIELTPVYKQRTAALDALARSAQGTGALIRYCLARHHGATLEDDLQWAALYAIIGISRHPIRTEGAETVSLDELRSFLLLVPASPHSLHIRGLQKRLSIEDVVALRDVWLAWLDAVKPELLPAQHTGSRDGNLLLEACDALRASDDPSGLDRVVKIARRAPKGSVRGTALRYLIELGDPRAFDLVIEEQGGLQCGTESQWEDIPWAATQDQLESLLRCRVFDFTMLSHRFSGRPDLARAVATVLAENGGLAEKLSNPGDINVTGIPLSQVAPVLETGAEAIPTGQLVSMVRRTSTASAWRDASFWIRLLGRRAALEGTQDLVDAALMESSLRSGGDPLVSAANRALLRRSLMPQTADAVIDCLQHLPPKERTRVASGMVKAMEQLPGIPLYDPRSSPCDVGPCGWNWQRWKPTSGSGSSRWQEFVSQYQNHLLQWLEWVPDPELLARIYPFMTGAMAKQRFRLLLLRGTVMSAEVTWRLSLDLPTDTLRAALDVGKADPVRRAFLLLRLAEKGDAAAYREMKDLVLPTFGARTGGMSRFQTPLLQEVARRRDTSFLWRALGRCPKGRAVAPSSLLVRFPGTGFVTQHDLLAAYLLRVDGSQVAWLLHGLDPANRDQRLELLRIATTARSAHAEPLLRKIEPHLDVPANRSTGSCWEDSRCRWWLAALTATRTSWCRDRLENLKEWGLLLELGDPRAGDEGDYPLETGRLDAAIGRYVTADRKDSNWGVRLALPGWGTTHNRLPKQKRAVDKSVRAVAGRWPSMSLRERVASVRMLQQYPESVSDDLLRLMLSDAFAPIRLSALRYLWRFPRPEMNSFLESTVHEDAVPWCRRLAAELLRRPIDPLQLAPSRPFQVAGFGSVVLRRHHPSPIRVWRTNGQEPNHPRQFRTTGSVVPALSPPPTPTPSPKR